MNFLVPDPTYPEQEELAGEFRSTLFADLNGEFREVAIREVDAGPSASIPALLIQLGPIADLIALFAGPVIIVQGVKWYKQQFEKVRAFLRERNLSFSIDPATGIALAADAVLSKAEADEPLEVVSVTRHCINLGGAFSDHRYFKPDEQDPWANDPHREAVAQLNTRYLILLRSGCDAFTAVVEKDGRVLLVEPLSF